MKLLKILGFVSASTMILLVSLWWAFGPNQPSDAELEQQFNRHRTDLDRLIGMMNEDWQMSRIAPDFIWRQDSVAWPRPESEWGISSQRWGEYQNIFAQAGFKGGITRREKSSDIIVDVWSWGIVPPGIRVGYLHCGTPRNEDAHVEPPCLENREAGTGMHGHSTSYGYRYKRIAPDWYIYEESN